MQRQKVDSSNIESIGYDVENEVLEIEFKSSKGEAYQDEFLEVSLEFYRSLIKEKEEKRFFELGLRRLKYQRKKGLR